MVVDTTSETRIYIQVQSVLIPIDLFCTFSAPPKQPFMSNET